MADQAPSQVRDFRRILRRFERIHRLLMDERDCCSGLTIAQCHPLLEIEEAGQTNLSDLASTLRLDSSTLSRTVEGLVQHGLVKRSPDSRDRRFVVLSLTAAGQEVCNDINQKNDRLYDQILTRLARRKRADAIRLFDDLVRALAEAVSPCDKCSAGKTE